jgi:hypothetical protein
MASESVIKPPSDGFPLLTLNRIGISWRFLKVQALSYNTSTVWYVYCPITGMEKNRDKKNIKMGVFKCGNFHCWIAFMVNHKLVKGKVLATNSFSILNLTGIFQYIK